jgi:hypothetical protein
LHHVEQVRRANVGGLNIDQMVVALQRNADPVPDVGVRAIATDKVAGENLSGLVVVEVACGRQHTILALLEIDHPRPIQDAQATHCGCVCEHHGLQINLIDTMRRLRRGPPAVGTVCPRISLRAAGNRNTTNLYSSRGRPEGDIVGVFGGKARIAHGVGQAQAAKYLHRSCADVVAPHARRFARKSRLGNYRADATLRQVHGQAQANRTTAHDQHLDMLPIGHWRTQVAEPGGQATLFRIAASVKQRTRARLQPAIARR